MPLHYTMARMRSTLYTFRYLEEFPAEAPMEIFVDSRKSTSEPVEATVSVLQSTAHLTSEIYEEALAKDGLVYFRPKLNGVCSWSIDFGPLGSVMIGHNAAYVVSGRSFGYSFERIAGVQRVPLAVAHMSDHINGFPTIEALEAAFGVQTECVVGIRLNGMLCEFKVKDVPTFELMVKQGSLFDQEGANYGATDVSDGIYEASMYLSNGHSIVSVIRQRLDKNRAQSGAVIRAAMAGPRYQIMRNSPIDVGRVVIGSISVGIAEKDKPVENLHNCEVFQAAGYLRQRPWREMLAYLAANHVRMVGSIFQVTPLIQVMALPAVEPRVLHHRAMSGGTLGGFLTTYRGFDFIHPYFPQAFLQTLYSLINTLLQKESNYEANIKAFMLAMDAAYHELQPRSRSVSFYFDIVLPYVNRYMGRAVKEFTISNPSMLRLMKVLDYNVVRKGISVDYWRMEVSERCIRFYQKPYMQRYMDWSILSLQRWDSDVKRSERSIKDGAEFVKKSLKRIQRSPNLGSMMAEWTHDLLNPVVLGLNNPGVHGCVFVWDFPITEERSCKGPHYHTKEELRLRFSQE